MKAQFTLKLEEYSDRPSLIIKDFNNARALIDTGSVFPVWLEKEEFLVKMGGKLIKRGVEFGGFGGKAIGNVYNLEKFRIGELTFPNFQIIAYKSEWKFQMILPATMFRNLIYEIDDYNHAFNVTVPDSESTVRNLVIKEIDGKLHVLCTSSDENSAETIIANQSSIFQ